MKQYLDKKRWIEFYIHLIIAMYDLPIETTLICFPTQHIEVLENYLNEIAKCEAEHLNKTQYYYFNEQKTALIAKFCLFKAEYRENILETTFTVWSEYVDDD